MKKSPFEKITRLNAPGVGGAKPMPIGLGFNDDSGYRIEPKPEKPLRDIAKGLEFAGPKPPVLKPKPMPKPKPKPMPGRPIDRPKPKPQPGMKYPTI